MGAFWGNKAWCPGGLKSKKTLSKHDTELFNIVSRINATDQYYSLYHPTGARITAGQDLRNFLWDGIHSRLSDDHWFNVMPQSFRALANLAAQTSAWTSTFDNYMLPGLITNDETVIKPDEYLFLWKQKKKVYYKPEVIQEMSEIINNSLSGSKVKYVVFSKQNWVRLVDSHGLTREYDVDVKTISERKRCSGSRWT